MGDFFEPVRQFYNAFSPDQLTDYRFQDLFRTESVNNVGALFEEAAACNCTTPPCPCPKGWVDAVRNILTGTDCYTEKHMNARMQRALTEHGLLGFKTEINDKVIQNEEGIEVELRDLQRVKEQPIRKLLLDCYNDNSYVGKERMNGLPITLKSIPDFVAWSKGGMLL